MALARTKSEAIAYIDDDDVWHEEHLACSVKMLEDDDIVLTGVHIIHSDGSPALVDGLCPWASDSSAAREQFDRLVELGVYARGESTSMPVIVTRPDGSLEICCHTSTSVFRGDLARRLIPAYSSDLIYRKGEIHDVIYRALHEGLTVKCLATATATYRLGGFSNGRLEF